MSRDDRTRVKEWADLVGETVSEEVTLVRDRLAERGDRSDGRD
ncbi:MAG: hypothetical protein V5A62_06715 [Haloarculaceae archaeon]